MFEIWLAHKGRKHADVVQIMLHPELHCPLRSGLSRTKEVQLFNLTERMADSAVSYEVGRLLQVPAKVSTPLICQVAKHASILRQ